MKKRLICLMVIPFFLFHLMPVDAAEKEETTWQDESIYYILVDRFANGTSSNDEETNIEDPKAYHGGDIEGIIGKLDYIKKLGFTAINLSPIMENGEKGYHGFWIEDFQKVEEKFGTLADVKRLIEEAHERDIKVIFDFVIGHTAATHPWLDDEIKQDWFVNGEQLQSDVSWLEGLPVLNWGNPEVSRYMLETANYWINETKVDGFRLGVNSQMSINDLKKFTTEINKKHPNFFLFANGEKVKNNKQELKGAGIDALANYPLYETAVSVFGQAGNSLPPLYERYEESKDSYGSELIRGNFVDTHETERFTKQAALNKQNPVTRWKLALTYLFTAPGVPIVYQGSEIPMGNGKGNFDHRMAQLNNGNEELKKYIEQLTAIRKKFPAITKGSFELVESKGAMSLFKRSYEGENVFVAINNDSATRTIAFDQVKKGMQLRGLIQDSIVREMDDGSYKVVLARETADIFIVEEDNGINWLFIAFILTVMGIFVGGIISVSIRNKKAQKSP